MHDNRAPRYLPHLGQAEILAMGLSPLARDHWIETDNDWPYYHDHKTDQRRQYADQVYRAGPESLPAQEELAATLLAHLTQEQPNVYRLEGETLVFLPGGHRLARTGDEPLWNCSLWVADDLVLMERRGDEYHLTAASLCSPSEWALQDKFDRPLVDIHSAIPGFNDSLAPAVNRFFAHLKAEHPVVRYNWSLQAGDGLARRPAGHRAVEADTPLFYRTERQTLRRLPRTGAIAFTIRVYLHPLELLPGPALDALWRAVDDTPPALAHYKGFHRLAPALARYRSAPAQ